MRAEDRVREGQPGHHGHVPAGLQGIRGRRADRAAPGRSPSSCPTLSLQAINLQRLFVDRGIAVDLAPFIAKEKNWKGQGFSKSMMALGNFDGKPYGLAFAVSTPIIYFNDDLVVKAGGDPNNFPTTWDGIFELSQQDARRSATTRSASIHSWAITGNWMWQALVFSHGGTMMSADEKKVAFDGRPASARSSCSAAWCARAICPISPTRRPHDLLRRQDGDLDRVDVAAARCRRGRGRQVQVANGDASRCPARMPSCRPAAPRR